MAGPSETDAKALGSLREKIDAIDAEMHRLLIARGEVIDSLIKIKGTSRPGNAFRPGREADMMRRIVARHAGALPLPTVEHIWREIITTFTRVQAPFDVAMDASTLPDRMRDLARFYFGFSVDLIPLSGPVAVVAHVAEANDLGLVPLGEPSDGEAWWRGMVGPSAPRIMAVLPFIRAMGRPADLPAFVISPPLADPTPPDLRLYAVAAAGQIRETDDLRVLASIAVKGGVDAVVAVPASGDAKAISRAVHKASDIIEIGGISRGIAVDEASSLLYGRLRQTEAVQ